MINLQSNSQRMQISTVCIISPSRSHSHLLSLNESWCLFIDFDQMLWFIANMFYQSRKSHYGNETVLQPSYIHNEIFYTGKMTPLFWIRAHNFYPTPATSPSFPIHPISRQHEHILTDSNRVDKSVSYLAPPHIIEHLNRKVNSNWKEPSCLSLVKPRLEPGDCLNIKMWSYQYRDSHFKDKRVSLTVLYLTWESPYLGKTVFILRRGPVHLRNPLSNRLNAHSQTDWAIKEQAHNLNVIACSNDKQAFSPLVATAGMGSCLALATLQNVHIYISAVAHMEPYQACSISIVNTLEILQSCTKLSIYDTPNYHSM